jgi:farnesyl-diphosphate farnesyltransferase
MSAPAPDLLTDLLRDVSRSFYLTLRLLPGAVRPQIGLAYLLARATDTIADTAVLPVGARLAALEALRDRILGTREEAVDFGELARNQALPAERELLTRMEEAIAVLGGFACFDRCCVRTVLQVITSGQQLDLRRFEGASKDRIVALSGAGDLDDYTFRVAGCVGEFWTRLCRSHLYPDVQVALPTYLEDGIRFGKGLQLVNILRDLPKDLREGRCYIPKSDLEAAGLEPSDLLDPTVIGRFRPVLCGYLELAARHLSAGWRYTCATPRGQRRVRLGCALPLLIGADTLRLVAAGNVLDPGRRLKVTRARVRSWLMRAVLLHPFPRQWERMFPADLPALVNGRG